MRGGARRGGSSSTGGGGSSGCCGGGDLRGIVQDEVYLTAGLDFVPRQAKGKKEYIC
jgi:hypothetical protein